MSQKIPLETQKALETLQKVAAETLDRKRRLGHYAVIWQDGRPVAIGEDAPAHLAPPLSQGQGDYTQERHACLDKTSLEDVLISMKQRPEDDTNQYDEIIE
jgi:hypothetical protein